MSLLQESIISVKSKFAKEAEEERSRKEADKQTKMAEALRLEEYQNGKLLRCSTILEESQIDGLFDDANNDLFGGLGKFSEGSNVDDKKHSLGTEYSYVKKLQGLANKKPVLLVARANTSNISGSKEILEISCYTPKPMGILGKIMRKEAEFSRSSRKLELDTGQVRSGWQETTLISNWQDLSKVSETFAKILVERGVV